MSDTRETGLTGDSISGAQRCDCTAKASCPVCSEPRLAELRRAAPGAELKEFYPVLEKSAELAMITDSAGVIQYVNGTFEKVSGFDRSELIGKNPNRIKSGLQSKAFYTTLWTTLQRGEVFSDIFVNRRKGGSLYVEQKTISPFSATGDGRVTHFVALGTDITAQINQGGRLQQVVHYCPVTELPNRFLFREHLACALLAAKQHGCQLALVMLDIDRFHRINDSLGPQGGDSVLKAFGARLRQQVPEEFTLANLGGDVFALFLECDSPGEQVPELVNTLFKALRLPFVFEGREIFSSASIGISTWPADGSDASALFRNAETAMRRAKRVGPNNYQFYTADMNARAIQRLDMESALRRALERNEFRVHYQPQVNLQSGRIESAEALLRWENPDTGMVLPGDFIPLLEESGLIMPVGDWVIRTACEQLRVWRAEGAGDIRVAVNLSALQFRHAALIPGIRRVLEANWLPFHALELEITESTLMERGNLASGTLRALAAMGLRVALDDFGTGYSSLAYLKRFPVNVLKLARPFVNGIPADSGDVGIARAVIALAHNLGLSVVAEGVETHEQLAFLRAERCDSIQGYVYSRPVPGEALSHMLRCGDQFPVLSVLAP